jgi:hypothetical protein
MIKSGGFHVDAWPLKMAVKPDFWDDKRMCMGCYKMIEDISKDKIESFDLCDYCRSANIKPRLPWSFKDD